MAFAAPAVMEGVATGTADTAAAGAASRKAAPKAAGSLTGVKVPTKTAAARADELHASGTGRGRARRALMDEYGATAGQADDLLDAAGTRAPAPDQPPADTPPAPKAGPSLSSQLGGSLGGAAGRGIGNGLNAGGGLILGTLLYFAGLTFLRGGTAGLKTWLAAKFLNKVPGSAAVPYSATAVTPGVGNAGSGLTLITGGGAGEAGGGVASPTGSSSNGSTATGKSGAW